MAKRVAESELNDRNWDDVEESEEAGIFAQATADVLQQRTIKKAKRRVADADVDSKPTAFGGFLGLAKKGSSQPKTDMFSGINKPPSQTPFSSKPSAFGGASSVNGSKNQKMKDQEDSKESSVYLTFLKSLNESVLAWIKQHVEENPYIILTPIFRDYEKYLENHEAEKFASSPSSKREPPKDTKNGETTSTFPITTTTAPFISTQVKVESEGKEKSEASKSKTFTFGQTSTAKLESSQPKGFSFGTSSTSSSMDSGFKFGSTTLSGFSFGQANKMATVTTSATIAVDKPTFSFGSTSSTQGSFSIAGTSSSQQTADADDEEYVPPKPEVKEIVEEGSLYSIRCKLYFQRDGQWTERGVGNIHLKPVEEKKTQILLRADTNLGNILLNIMLSASMPVSRQGKNNVFFVCIPNPPITSKPGGEEEDKPTPMLIRVKTEQDADELLAKINERKTLL